MNLLELRERGFEITKEAVDENVVCRRLEDNKGNVVVLEQAFYPPDEIETNTYIIKGEIPPEKTSLEEIKEFEDEIAIIRFVIANMHKIIKGEVIPIIDIIEGPNRHPHYHSRITTDLYYDFKNEMLVYDMGCSGSPSCWSHYSNNEEGHEHELGTFELARKIRKDIKRATILIEKEVDDFKVEYMKIEGM